MSGPKDGSGTTGPLSEEQKKRLRDGMDAARDLESGDTSSAELETETPPGPPENSVSDLTVQEEEDQYDGSVDLPVGLILPDGTVSKRAFVRGLSGKVRRLLAAPENRRNGGRAISALLTECVASFEGIGNHFDIDNWVQKLTVADRDALAFAIRRVSLGTTIATTMDCPNPDCKEPIDIEFDLLALKATLVGDTPFKVTGGHWAARLKSEKFKTEFLVKLPDGFTQEKVAPVAPRNPVEASYLMLQLCLLEHDKQTRFPKNYIEEVLEVNMLDWLDKTFSQALPGIKDRPQVQCEVCQTKFPIQYDVVDFLFSRQEKRISSGR